MEKLTHSEEEAMLILWKLGIGAIKDVLNEYPVPRPPYTTLASVIKKLEAKGYLETRLYGNTNVYTPLVSQEEYKSSFLSGIVDNYFGHSFQNLITFFAEKEKISVDELKDVIRLIERGKRK
jgi:BlaI family transcriptional regulator, penicillinase repressor